MVKETEAEMYPAPAASSHDTQPQTSDCSWNARIDMPENYSRFHGNPDFSVCCNSAGSVRYTDSLREVVYQMSPYNITCMYKSMFEQYSIFKLRIVDNDSVPDNHSDVSSLWRAAGNPPGGVLFCPARLGPAPGRSCSSPEPSSPRPASQPHGEHVDKSNSCIYSATSLASKHSTTITNKHNFVSGWRTCERPHSSGVTGYQSMTIEETREARKLGKLGINREPSCKTFHSSLRNPYARNHQQISLYKYETQGSGGGGTKKMSRERGEETGNHRWTSSVTALNISPIKVGRRFKHFRRSNSYIDQYRDEYTHRRLRTAYDPSPPVTLGNSACSDSLTAARCLQRWYPNQSQTLKTQNITACEKASDSATTGAPTVPMRKPVPNKRPSQSHSQTCGQLQIWQASKLDEAKRKGGYLREGCQGTTPRIELFATSFTVNSYNPSSPGTASQRSSSSSSSSSPSPVTVSGSYHGTPSISSAPQTRSPRRHVQHVNGVN